VNGERSSRGSLYELDALMKLAPLNDPAGEREIAEVSRIPRGILTSDAALSSAAQIAQAVQRSL
jgi:hypothetical protein